MMEKQVKTLDEQFHEVSVAIAESRNFTDFCFTRLDTRIGGLDERIGVVETRLGSLETKVGSLDAKVGSVDGKVDSLAVKMDRRFTRQELLLTELLNEVRARPRA